MSPSCWFFGSRAWPLPLSGTAVVSQSLTLCTGMMRRHLPTCTTRGRGSIVGTPFSVNEPSTPVTSTTNASLTTVSHALHEDVPGVIGGSASGSAAIQTTTLLRGTLPAGSYTLPVSVVL